MPSDHQDLIVHFNGRYVPWRDATVHVFSPFAKYGAAVFEGIRGYWSQKRGKMLLFRLREHMERLELSQRIMRFDRIVSADEMCEAALELVRRNAFRTSVHIRSDGVRRRRGRVVGPRSDRVLHHRGSPRHSAAGDGRVHGAGLVLGTHQRSVDAGPGQGQRQLQQLPSRRHPGRIDGYDAAIMLNSRGKVAEGQGMCLFLVRNGAAVTPSVTSDILESITRDTVLALLGEMGVDTVERDVDRSEFFAASEAFFCGTGWEITPVNAVDGSPIGAGRPGPITKRLQKAYFDLVTGVSGEHPEWITEA